MNFPDIASDKPLSKFLQAALYLARSLGVLAVTAWFFGRILLARFAAIDAQTAPDWFASLHLFRALFYGLSPAALLLLFLPHRAFEHWKPLSRIALALPLGILSAVAPLYALSLTGAAVPITTALKLALFYMGLNIAVLIFLRGIGFPASSRAALWIRRGCPLSDFLLPAALWNVYRSGKNPILAPARLIPAITLLLPFACLFLSAPSFTQPPRRFSPEAKVVLKLPGQYGIEPDERGDLLWISSYRTLTRYHVPSGLKTATTKLFCPDGVNKFALDSAKKNLVAFGWDGRYHVYRYNASTLSMTAEETFLLSDPHPIGSTIALWDDARDILVSVFECGAVRFPADNGALTVLPCGMSVWMTDAVLDPARRMFYVCFARFKALAAYDADTLELVRLIEIPDTAQRMVLDAASDRLFAACPIDGVIRVVDLKRFEVVDSIPSIIGVRTLALDEKRRLLFAGGFSPFMEVYRLADFSLAARFMAPPWQRTMAVSAEKQTAYFTTHDVVGSLNYKNSLDSSIRRALDRADLFFIFQRWAARPFSAFLKERIEKTFPVKNLESVKPGTFGIVANSYTTTDPSADSVTLGPASP